MRRRINAAFARLALRSREATHPVAKHHGVHALADVQQAVAVNVETGVDSRAALVARGEGFEGFRFNQPRGGKRFFWVGIDEGVVVHGEEQDSHQGEGLKHGEPASVTMVWGVFRLFLLLFFSLVVGL